MRDKYFRSMQKFRLEPKEFAENVKTIYGRKVSGDWAQHFSRDLRKDLMAPTTGDLKVLFRTIRGILGELVCSYVGEKSKLGTKKFEP